MPRPIHFEIHADDPERAVSFYDAVFGWRIAKWDGPVDYWLVTTGEEDEPGINGAILRRMGGTPGDSDSVNAFVNTIQVDSIERAEGNVFGTLEPA